MDAQDKATRARELYLKIEAKHRDEQSKTMRDQERERIKLDGEIKSAQNKQKAWHTRAMNAERDLQLEMRKQQTAANNTHSPTTARQNRLRA